jgi:hypothetical protein
MNLLALAFALLLILSACSSSAAPLSPGGSSPPGQATASPAETPVSADPGSGSSAGSGGGTGGQSGPQVVVPKPGATNVHPVAIEKIVAKVDGRHVKLNATWWSGIEPCTVLDSTAFKIDGSKITVSVREGTGNGEVACIDIAVQKLTVIDLGQLDAGKYTIVADKGEAPPLHITVI